MDLSLLSGLDTKRTQNSIEFIEPLLQKRAVCSASIWKLSHLRGEHLPNLENDAMAVNSDEKSPGDQRSMWCPGHIWVYGSS